MRPRARRVNAAITLAALQQLLVEGGVLSFRISRYGVTPAYKACLVSRPLQRGK